MRRYIFEQRSISAEILSGEEIKAYEKMWGRLLRVIIEGNIRIDCQYHGSQIPVEDLVIIERSRLK